MGKNGKVKAGALDAQTPSVKYNSISDRVDFFQVALDYFTKGKFDLKAEDVPGNGHCQLLAVLMSVNATWTED